MSIPTTVINMAMTVGEDKTFIDPIYQADGVGQQNVTSWTAVLVIHKVNDPDTVFLTVTCTVVTVLSGLYPNALQAVVAAADTTSLIPGQYAHYWKRTDSGNVTVVSSGLFTLVAP